MSVTTLMVLKLSILLLLNRGSTVIGNPTGPPISACSDQIPNHGGTAQTSGSPYSLTVSPSTYSPGSTIQVTISGSTFKGFFVQARRQDSNYGSTSEAIGQFGSAPSDTKLLSCSPGSNNGWVHSNRDDKSSKTITWTAPSTDEGPIRFRSTVVQAYSNYWAPDATTSTQITYSAPAAPSWNDWNEWGSCTVTCGSGTQTRTRTCNDPDTSDSTTCSGSADESRDCNTQSCPVPTWDDWSSWGTCSVTCDGGTQTRTRTCNDPDTTDSTTCSGSADESRDCNTQSCPTDGDNDVPTWDDWSSWGTCSVTCGGGTQTRTRTCSDPDTTDSTTCSGSADESRDCNTQSCPTDGGSDDPTWNTWGSYSTCSHTCGSGTQIRTRSCNDPDTTDNIVCAGESSQTVQCNTQSCPGGGDPSWGSWSPYTTCTVTCGSGSQTRSRICNDPDGTDERSCAGSGTDTRSCNTQSCPEPMWNSWSPYTGCTRSCGTGTRTRTRTCADPDDTDNDYCIGSATDTSACNTQACPNIVDGSWTAWNEWTGCSTTCNTGIRSRTRSCTPTATSCEGLGDALQTESCFQPPCESGLEWNEWSKWSPCSVTCDNGQRQRVRTCDNPDQSQSERCHGDSVETERCNERCCDCGTVELETFIWILVGIIGFVGVLGLIAAPICIYVRTRPQNAPLVQPYGSRPQPPPLVPRRPPIYYY